MTMYISTDINCIVLTNGSSSLIWRKIRMVPIMEGEYLIKFFRLLNAYWIKAKGIL